MKPASLVAVSLLLCACAGSHDDDPTTTTEAIDVHGNPASARIPDSYVQYAREREIVAVAGTGAGSDAHDWLARGWGTEAAPLHEVQALEAVSALEELAGSGTHRIWAWGWPEVDPARTYFYRSISGATFEVHFISDEGIGPAYRDFTKFSESNVLDDATRLRSALDRSESLRGKPLMVVGHSWGGAVIDYGMTRTASRAEPDALHAPILGDALVAIAIAVPKDLPTLLQPWPFIGMSADGDYDGGRFLVRRRPDDLVGKGGLWPVLSGFGGPTHNYTMAWHEGPNGAQARGGFWGISGPGMLCSASFGDNCPWPE